MSDEQTNPIQETPTPAQNSGNTGAQGSQVPPATTTDKPDPSWLNPRLEKAAKAAQTKLLKELGFKDLDEAKARLATANPETQAAEKSEIEKLRASVESEKQARIKAEQKQQINVVSNAIRTIAKEAIHVDDVVDKFSLSTSLAEYMDGDEPNKKKIETKLAQIRKERPNWFKTTPGSPSNSSGTIPKPEKDALAKAREQLQSQVRRGF